LGDRNNQGDLAVGEKLDDGKKQKNDGKKVLWDWARKHIIITTLKMFVLS